MALTEKELEKQLMESGNAILSPPSSAKKLLSLLNRVEKLLTRVEQSPSESMKKALSPSTKALIANDLLRHSDVDVKVAVASCISEITRITAPDAPYEDDQMKEVFGLIVSSFEKLDDIHSLSYFKRTSILETVAKVRSCVVMLDLECDSLIIEMFQHFLRSIREYHPENIFSSMETIMILVLEESEEVSVELLLPILDFLRRPYKEVLPIARELAVKVIEKCAKKVKPNLLPAVEARGGTLYDYSRVVAKVCKMDSEAVEPSDGDAASKNLVEKSDLADASTEKPVEVAMETLDDAPPSEEVGPTMAGSPKSVMSNGNLQKDTENSSALNDVSKEEDRDANDGIKTAAELSKPNSEGVDTGELANAESNSEKSNKQKGGKGSLKNLSEPSLTDNEEAPKSSALNDDSNEEDRDADDGVKTAALLSKPNSESKDTGELANAKSDSEKSNKRKEGKGSLKNSSEPSLRDNKEAAKSPGNEKRESKEVDIAQSTDTAADAAENAENEKELDAAEHAENEKKPDAAEHDVNEKEPDAAEHAENEKEPEAAEHAENEDAAEHAENEKEPEAAEHAENEKEHDATEHAENEKEPEAAEHAENEKEPDSTEHTELEKEPDAAEHAENEKEPDASEHAENEKEPDASEHAENEKEPDAAEHAENEKEPDAAVCSPKKLENEPLDVPSPSSRGSPDENRTKKGVQVKKKDDQVQNTESAGDIDSRNESDMKKATEGSSVSKSKSQKRIGKKASSAVKKKDSIPSPVHTSKNEDEDAHKLDEKSAKQSGKKVEAVSSQRKDKKKRGQTKGTPAKDLAKTPSREDKKTPVPKSAAKSSKDESDAENTPKAGSKRKQSPREEKGSAIKGYGAELIGKKVKVWWPVDKAYYEGVVDSFDSVKMKHKVVYIDGDVEILKLAKERWELIEDDSPTDQEHASDAESPDESTETPKRKKAKTIGDPGSKQGKTETTAKKGGASSNKSKSTPKSGRKQKDDIKVDSKTEDASKSISKSDEDKAGKLKDLKRGNKSEEPKSAAKSKNVEAKVSNKSKQEAPKGATKSKGKSPKTSTKSNTNGTGEGKAASLSKEEDEAEDAEESPEPTKAAENAKGKSPSATKSQKSGKKRKRGGKR